MDNETLELWKARYKRFSNRQNSDGTRYALSQLAVGEDVLIPCTVNPDRYRTMCAQLGRETGRYYTARIERDLIDGGTIEGVRVTRVT